MKEKKKNETKLNISLTPDANLITRDVPCERVLEIAVDATIVTAQVKRPHLNLALVIDRSGSMHGSKLEYAKQAALHLVDMLAEEDLVALVVYDDDVDLLFPSQPAISANRSDLKLRIAGIQTGGSTNLGGGWLAGCQEAAAAAAEGTINRVLLLSDGLANRGITDPEDLARHARELSLRGVSTSTFGIGLDFNEHLLEAISGQGGGNYYFIESPYSIPSIFEKEFRQLQTITVKDVEVTLVAPQNVKVTVLGAWRVLQENEKTRIFLGGMQSGRHQEVYVRLITPPADDAKTMEFTASVNGVDEENTPIEGKDAFVLTYASKEEEEKAPRQMAVLQRYAIVDVANTATEALRHERRGDHRLASEMLNDRINANRPHLSREQVDQYQNMSQRMSRGMEEWDRKRSHQTTHIHRHRKEDDKNNP